MRDIFLPILVVVAACVLGTVWLHVRYARLGEQRRASGSSYESFQSELGSRVSTEVCRTVYDHFYDLTGKKMPVVSSDDLGEVYGIFGDELVDQLRELAVKCQVAAPTVEDAFLVSTVLDAALLMESLRQEDGREPG